jgi:hypothetical protein
MSTTTVNQSYSAEYTPSKTVGLWQRFMHYCEAQENNRLLWLGISLAGHGCIITPLTVMAVLLAGSNLFLFILALVAMGMSLVSNLAAMPTKATIPIFFVSMILDIAIIFSCVLLGFDISKTYI